MCFCMLRCSMLLPAAERRPTVTPISCLEGRTKMLISASPFAPSFAAPYSKFLSSSRSVHINLLISLPQSSIGRQLAPSPSVTAGALRVRPPSAPGGARRRRPAPAVAPHHIPCAKSARGRLHVPYPIPEYNCTRTVPNLNPGLYPVGRQHGGILLSGRMQLDCRWQLPQSCKYHA